MELWLVKRPFDLNIGNDDGRGEITLSAVRELISHLSNSDREMLLAELTKSITPISAPRAGDVLSAVIKLLPKDETWSVSKLKTIIEEHGIGASDKEVYNALGYLTRRKYIRRIGYGRYMIDGVAITTADDLGGQPAITEGDADD